jgi:hypothetical protein
MSAPTRLRLPREMNGPTAILSPGEAIEDWVPLNPDGLSILAQPDPVVRCIRVFAILST